MDEARETEARLSSELLERDRSRLASHVGLSVSGQAAAFAAGLACMVLTTRLLGPAGYGRLEVFFMLVAVLSQVVVGWPNLGLVRYGREEFARRRSLAESFTARAALFAVSLMVAAALLAGLRHPLAEYLDLATAPRLLLLYVAFNEAFFAFGRVFQVVSRFRAYALTTVGVQGLKFLLILVAFVLLGWPATVARLIQVQIVAVGAVLALGGLALPWRSLLPLRLDLAALRRMFSYSWPLMLGGLSVLVVDWVDLAVIKEYRPAQEVGWYAVSYRPLVILAHLRVAFIGAVLPLMVSLAVERRHGSLRWFLDEGLPQVAWTVGLLCILGAALMEAIPLILGRPYGPSVVPAQVLLAGVGFSVVSALHAALLRALDRVRPTVAVGLALAGLNLVLDLWLVPRLGTIGAATATAAAFALSGTLYFPLVNRVESLRGGAPRRRYATLFGLAGPLLLAGCVVFLPDPAWRLTACAALLLGSAGMARWAGVFRPSTLEKLEGLAMPRPARTATRWFFRILGR